MTEHATSNALRLKKLHRNGAWEGARPLEHVFDLFLPSAALLTNTPCYVSVLRGIAEPSTQREPSHRAHISHAFRSLPLDKNNMSTVGERLRFQLNPTQTTQKKNVPLRKKPEEHDGSSARDVTYK